MLDAFSATIEKIYSAASGASEWEQALQAIEELTGCAGAVIHLVDRQNTADSAMLISTRLQDHFDAAELEEWTRDLLPMCPRVAAVIAQPDAPVIFDRMILSESEMDRHPVYDWYQRHGLRYFIGSSLGETQRYKLMWSLQRTQSQGHVQESDAEHFELIKPHVERALCLAEQIGSLRSFQRFSSAMIEALPQAIFALDGKGRLLFANGAGQALLRSADGLVDAGGHLKASCSLEQGGVDDLIRRAIDPMRGTSSGWTRVSRPSGRLPYALFVSPLVVSADDPTTPEAKVLVVAHDTGSRQAVDPSMLKSVYGLTETESRLTAALADGHSLESAASVLAMRPATARTHLKAVFSKLGVHRQQDLTRLLAFLSTVRPGA